MTRGETFSNAVLIGMFGLTVTCFVSRLAGCSESPVPGPVPVGEASASSGCELSTFQCCQTWVTEPTCKDGTLTCQEGWVTCTDAGTEGDGP